MPYNIKSFIFFRTQDDPNLRRNYFWLKFTSNEEEATYNFKSSCQSLYNGIDLEGVKAEMVYCCLVSGERGYSGLCQMKFKICKQKLVKYFGEHISIRCLAKQDVARGKSAVDALHTEGDGKEVVTMGEFYRQGGLKR